VAEIAPVPAAARCACGVELAPALLACPACRRLVHADALRAVSARAGDEERGGDLSAALASWREVLALLPRDSRQHATVAATVAALAPRVQPPPEAAAPPPSHPWLKRGGALAAVALLVWKFKFVLALVLGKAKLLLLGLTELGTIGSMLASFGVYWGAWGWRFAAGLVASIYVHEMGHVAALRARGVAASAPMFIPGVGAYVRLGQPLASAADDARVGLAGPLWGLAAAAAAWAASLAVGSPLLAAVAQTGARINLFNLVPVWQLDGARAFRALSRNQRLLACAAVAAAWWASGEGFLLLVLLVGALRVFSRDAPAEGDSGALATFALVLAGLTAIAAAVSVPAR
jgi:Zn-dependent protease